MKSLLRIGLLGGTFHPVHFGHLLLARDAREQLALDEVWLLPNNRSPLRLGETLAPASLRLSLLVQAVQDEPGLRVCEAEVKREGVSYTVDTLAQLHAQHPEVEWTFLIGADSLQTLDRWVRVHDLAALAQLVVVARPGIDLEGELASLSKRDPELALRIQVLPHTRRIDISATEVRERLAAGKSVRYLVPACVEAGWRQSMV